MSTLRHVDSKRRRAVWLAAATWLLAACGGSDNSGDEFAVTLTDVELVKQGSHERLPVEGLPAPGGTLVSSPGRPIRDVPANETGAYCPPAPAASASAFDV